MGLRAEETAHFDQVHLVLGAEIAALLIGKGLYFLGQVILLYESLNRLLVDVRLTSDDSSFLAGEDLHLNLLLPYLLQQGFVIDVFSEILPFPLLNILVNFLFLYNFFFV